jgi:Icc protein
MRIAQISDLHLVDGRYEERLLDAAIDEINAEGPDLVAVAGDLTVKGYRDEFEAARAKLDRLECPDIVYVPGNHDAKSVGYLHFEDLFGDRMHCRTVEVPEGRARVVCVDSSKPDVDEGEVGRELYGWILDSFEADVDLRVFVMHHHLVSIPGTGRERNQIWDAGDVLEILRSAKVDVVLGGHRHVPHVWPISGFFLIHSGTVCTRRLRGYAQPSYNFVTVTSEELEVEMRIPGGDRELLARFPRPLEPIGEHRCVDAARVVRRQRGGTFHTDEREGAPS